MWHGGHVRTTQVDIRSVTGPRSDLIRHIQLNLGCSSANISRILLTEQGRVVRAEDASFDVQDTAPVSAEAGIEELFCLWPGLFCLSAGQCHLCQLPQK